MAWKYEYSSATPGEQKPSEHSATPRVVDIGTLERAQEECVRLLADRARLVEALRDLREAAVLARTGAQMAYDPVQRADALLRELGEL